MILSSMRFALAILCIAAPSFAQRPTDAEATAIIEKARAYALAYTVSLPDFLATQVVHRYHDPRNNDRWQRLDVLTVRLSFSERAEDYKLIEIDGKPTLLDYSNTGGPTSKGEFGTLLLFLFHPKMEAEFRWKGWTNIHKRRAAVYSYKVDQAHTQYHISYGIVAEGPNHIVAPYYGEVSLAPETGEILHITQHAILPLSFPIRQSATTVEYSYADVGGRKYLLPSTAEVTMSTGRYKTRNVVDFKEYRKFQTEATITFDK
jgi:hypothetical protein